MSHFTVLVIGEDHEAQLAPFQENNMGDCPKQYLQFEEDPDAEIDEQTGKKGYWRNPNSKWDWYLVGGRWGDFFRLKPGRIGVKGERPLVMGGGRPSKKGYADQCLKRDIDIDGMRDDAGTEAANAYDFAIKLVGDLPPNRPWAEIRSEHEKDIDAAREAYHAQPRVAAWNTAAHEAHKTGSNWPFGIFDNPDFLLTTTREHYIATARAGAVSTHAVLKDGKWYERGTMGWWGHIHDEKDEETWLSMFAKLIDDLPEDTIFTVVDCHI